MDLNLRLILLKKNGQKSRIINLGLNFINNLLFLFNLLKYIFIEEFIFNLRFSQIIVSMQ